MEISSTIPSILGAYLLVSGIFLITKGKTLPTILRDFFDHKAVVFLAGAILIFLGGALAFDKMAETWIRILGSAILLKGAIYILAPEIFEKMNFFKIKQNLFFFGLIAIVAGIYLLV